MKTALLRFTDAWCSPATGEVRERSVAPAALAWRGDYGII
jgi:hypothetical protein